jgi:hypothetical protein
LIEEAGQMEGTRSGRNADAKADAGDGKATEAAAAAGGEPDEAGAEESRPLTRAEQADLRRKLREKFH